jgi:hypothetical protein
VEDSTRTLCPGVHILHIFFARSFSFEHNNTKSMLKTQNSTLLRQSKIVPTSLRRRWWTVTMIYGTLWACGYLLLPATWHQQGFAKWWALQSALTLTYLLWHFQRGLPDNHRQGETALLPALGLGNSLTLLHGLAIGLLAGFLFLVLAFSVVGKLCPFWVI